MSDELPSRPSFLPPGFGTVGHRDFVEVIVPDPVPYEPRTGGWYVLGALALVGVGIAVAKGVRRYRNNAYRREALRELDGLREALVVDRSSALARLPGLLKRCALAAFPRSKVAGLSGESWLAFLDRTAPGVWTEEARQALFSLVVYATPEITRGQERVVFEAAERWMRGHRA